jgi:ribosomal protein S20
MPIIKQAIKRAKQSLVRRSRNLQVKRAVKSDITALHTAIVAGENSEIQTKLSAAYSELDRAVKKHTLHKNTAARRKSQLATAVAKAENAEAKPAVAAKVKGPKKAATKPTAKKVAAAKKPVEKKPVAAKKPAAKKAPAKKTAEK